MSARVSVRECIPMKWTPKKWSDATCLAIFDRRLCLLPPRPPSAHRKGISIQLGHGTSVHLWDLKVDPIQCRITRFIPGIFGTKSVLLMILIPWSWSFLSRLSSQWINLRQWLSGSLWDYNVLYPSKRVNQISEFCHEGFKRNLLQEL